MTELQRIEFLSMIISSFIRNGLTGAASKHFLNRQFHSLSEDDKKQYYKTNPANTVLYQSNEALIETAIVKVVEHYRHEEKKHGAISIQIPDIEELRKHRVVISHPANITFSDPKIQEFYDADLQYTDPVAVRLWRVQSLFDSKIIELGGTVKYPVCVPVQLGTVGLIHSALAVSLNDRSNAGSLDDVARVVFPYFKKYEEAIKKLANNPES